MPPIERLRIRVRNGRRVALGIHFDNAHRTHHFLFSGSCQVGHRLLVIRVFTQALSLNAKIDDGATNLHSFVEARQERRALLDKHKCAKFTLVVLEQELATLELYLRVAAADRDVIDAQITLMTTA